MKLCLWICQNDFSFKSSKPQQSMHTCNSCMCIISMASLASSDSLSLVITHVAIQYISCLVLCLKTLGKIWNGVLGFSGFLAVFCFEVAYTQPLHIWFYQCKIFFFFFIKWTPKAVFSCVARPWVKIPLKVFTSEIKLDLTLKQSSFLFML